MRIAINGFGRIGRTIFRCLGKRPEAGRVVAINDVADCASLAIQLKYDSTYGRYPGSVQQSDGGIIVDDREIPCCTEVTPGRLPWGKLNIDAVIECTGVLTRVSKYDVEAVSGVRRTSKSVDSRSATDLEVRRTPFRDMLLSGAEGGMGAGYRGHLDAGAKRVCIAGAFRGDCDLACVFGVNDDHLDASHRTISCCSSPVNALAPLLRLLHDRFGVQRAFATSLHASANDQQVADRASSDVYFGRSAVQNLIACPVTSTAGVGVVVPELRGRIQGTTVRTPLGAGSMIDLTVETCISVDPCTVNVAIREASTENFAGIVGYTDDPIVSRDVVGDSHSIVVAGPHTQVNGETLLKVVGWYDNEWGYASRCVDLLERIGQLGAPSGP